MECRTNVVVQNMTTVAQMMGKSKWNYIVRDSYILNEC